MSRPAQAAAVAEQSRAEQVALKAGFLAQFVPTWDLLDWENLDRTTPAWIRVVMAVIRPWRQASANAAARRYAEYRQLLAADPLVPAPSLEFVGAPDPFAGLASTSAARTLNAPVTVHLSLTPSSETATVDWTEADKAAEHSLLVTGPGELKRQASLGRTEQQAKARGLVTSSGAASRQVLNGGRTTTLTAVGADDQAVGWARLTDGNPCAFCMVLSSRGPVYKSEASAGFKAHDACACIPVAVFSKTAPWPGDSRAHRRLYNKVAAGQPDPINALRRHLAAMQREAARPLPQIA